MKKLFSLLLFVSLLVVSCKKENSNPAGDNSGGGALQLGQIVATVDGRAFAGAGGASVDIDGITIEGLLIAGADTAAIHIFIASPSPPVNSAITLGDTQAGAAAEAAVLLGFANAPYWTGVNGATGSVTLTGRSATAVVGRASFTGSDGTNTKAVTGLSFNAPVID